MVHERCGVDFSERWHKDPLYRYKTFKLMKAELVKAFPAIPYWDLSWEDDLATISGYYGAHVIARVFGLPLRYAPDRWPVPEPGRTLLIRAMENLDVEMLLRRDMEKIYRELSPFDIVKADIQSPQQIHGYRSSLRSVGALNRQGNGEFYRSSAMDISVPEGKREI